MHLYISTKSEPYNVQRSLLLNASNDFERHITKGRSGKSDLRLKEVDEGTIELFLYWLFNEGRFPLPPEPEWYDDKPREDTRETLSTYVRLWLFGWKYRLSPMQNAIMHHLHYWANTLEVHPSFEIIRLAYEKTEPEQYSPIREFMMDRIACGLKARIYPASKIGELGKFHGFTEDLAVAFSYQMYAQEDAEVALGPYIDYLMED